MHRLDLEQDDSGGAAAGAAAGAGVDGGIALAGLGPASAGDEVVVRSGYADGWVPKYTGWKVIPAPAGHDAVLTESKQAGSPASLRSLPNILGTADISGAQPAYRTENNLP